MTAYIIARVDVTDAEQYAKYRAETPAAIAEFGGRFIVRGGEAETLEGAPENRRVVVIEFPSMERLREFFHSERYQKVRALRLEASQADVLAVDGVD